MCPWYGISLEDPSARGVSLVPVEHQQRPALKRTKSCVRRTQSEIDAPSFFVPHSGTEASSSFLCRPYQLLGV
jgi:hypothetical protein